MRKRSRLSGSWPRSICGSVESFLARISDCKVICLWCSINTWTLIKMESISWPFLALELDLGEGKTKFFNYFRHKNVLRSRQFLDLFALHTSKKVKRQCVRCSSYRSACDAKNSFGQERKPTEKSFPLPTIVRRRGASSAEANKNTADANKPRPLMTSRGRSLCGADPCLKKFHFHSSPLRAVCSIFA